jgi:hypothetical protein
VLAEHWTGQRWALARLPLPPGAGSGLNAISGTSANDIWAVGFQALGVGTQYTLTMHYDGSSWTIVPSYPTNLSNLFAVKAIAPDDVWAIGVQYTSPIAIHWDGTSWTSFPLPIQTNPPIINTVPVSLDATASDDVWAVGWENVPTGTEGQTTFAEAYHWDGTRWVTVPIAGLETSGSAIHGIASIGPDNVWVLGNAGADQLTVHFDGTAWTAVPNPGGGFYAGWHPLAASPAGDVWAVGETDYTSSTFALHYR